MRWTEEQYQEYIARQPEPRPCTFPEDDITDRGPESVLAGKILKYCDEHGYPCQCYRKSKKAYAFLVPGWPD